MTDIPKRHELGQPMDGPPGPSPDTDLTQSSLPGVSDLGQSASDILLPGSGMPDLPGLAGTGFSGDADVRPDITRPPEPSVSRLPGHAEAEAFSPREQDTTASLSSQSEARDATQPDDAASDELRGLFSETAMDLPPQEYQTVASTLEAFAINGVRISRPIRVPAGEGTYIEVEDRGYGRHVSPDALAAEGVPYEWVDVSAMEGSAAVPYGVGLTATRQVVKTVEITDASGNSGPVEIPGQENKSVSFCQEAPGDAMLTMDAFGTLRTLTPMTVDLPGAGKQSVFVPTLDGNAPPMTLDELRGIVRAVERADEFPEDPASIALRATLGANDAPPGTEITGAEGEHCTDIPQPGRGALLREMDTYARSGVLGQHLGQDTYTRSIPRDVLEQHGISGGVQVSIVEDYAAGSYRVEAYYSDQDTVTAVNQSGEAVQVPGIREGYLTVSTQAGRMKGYSEGGSTDETAGDGIALEYVGHTAYEDPTHGSGRMLFRDDPPIGSGDVGRLLQALREANRRA